MTGKSVQSGRKLLISSKTTYQQIFFLLAGCCSEEILLLINNFLVIQVIASNNLLSTINFLSSVEQEPIQSKTHRIQAAQRGINGRRNSRNILDIALLLTDNAQQKISITIQQAQSDWQVVTKLSEIVQ
jgi:hypothetical protein